MIIYAHRGIDLERGEMHPENSLAAFRWCAEQGFGVELDLQMASGELVVSHDPVANKTPGLCRFVDVLDLARKFTGLQLAVHLKGTNQTDPFIKCLIDALAMSKDLHSRILIFDLRPKTALVLRDSLKRIGLAPSVAKAFDVERFNAKAAGTLLRLSDALVIPAFDWLWLDEWDRKDSNGRDELLYSSEIARRIPKHRAVFISPELHAYDGHPDGASIQSLERRWSQILPLNWAGVCTDYPARFSGVFSASGRDSA